MSIKEQLENFTDWLMDWLGASTGLIVAGVILLFIVGGAALIYGVYQNAVSEKIELQKSNWTCTATKPHISTIYVQSGKVLVPIEQRIDECVNYQRNY